MSVLLLLYFVYLNTMNEQSGKYRVPEDEGEILPNRRVLNFELIDGDRFNQYIAAVQKASAKDYKPMEKIIKLIF